MRFHITTGFSQALEAHRAAYAVHDAFAEAGDDGVSLGGTAESDAASAEEYRTLEAFALFPCTTPREASQKLLQLRQRGPLHPDHTCWNGLEAILDQLNLDLINMQRPNVSPALAEAFAGWADAHRAMIAARGTADGSFDPLFNAAEAALRSLNAVPCTTPGDFIAKAYVNLMDDIGPASAASPFEIDASADALQDERENDVGAKAALYRDIMDSDLGLCMAILGRTDFDAEAWIAAADACGHNFAVMVDPDKARGFSQSMDGQEPQETYCLRLLAGGLGAVSDQRIKAVADAAQANHPAHVVDLRGSPELAAASATAYLQTVQGATAEQAEAREIPGIKSMTGA